MHGKNTSYRQGEQSDIFPDHFQIERNTILVTVFLLIMNRTDFRLVHNKNRNLSARSYPL